VIIPGDGIFTRISKTTEFGRDNTLSVVFLNPFQSIEHYEIFYGRSRLGGGVSGGP
jgi:hypothetical protein